MPVEPQPSGTVFKLMKSIFGNHLLAVGSLFLVGSLQAATHIWDGGAPDGFGAFSNPLNWDGDVSVPTSVDDTLQVGPRAAGGGPIIGFESGEFRTPSFTFLGTAV